MINLKTKQNKTLISIIFSYYFSIDSALPISILFAMTRMWLQLSPFILKITKISYIKKIKIFKRYKEWISKLIYNLLENI